MDELLACHWYPYHHNVKVKVRLIQSLCRYFQGCLVQKKKKKIAHVSMCGPCREIITALNYILLLADLRLIMTGAKQR